VLLADLILSGAIIFAAIWLFIRSSLYQGDVTSFAEVLGAFSIFSVFFYSTFLTSIWTWGYILSTWFMRLFTATPLARWVDPKNADKWLVFVGSAVVLVAALGVAVPLQKGSDGVSAADRMLCSAFPGVVCNRVAELTADEKAKLGFIMQACAGGVTEQCLQRGFNAYEVDNSQAVRLWAAACQGGDVISCTSLGSMLQYGLGVERDVERAVTLYRQGCSGGIAVGCTSLGAMYQQGLGVQRNAVRAVELYGQGCKGRNAKGCSNLGVMYSKGLGVERDVERAVTLYRQGCKGRNAVGCTNLGEMYRLGLGVGPDAARAVVLYRQGCEGGSASGCYNTGVVHEIGSGIAIDMTVAVEFYTKACELGHDKGCRRADDLAVATDQ